MSAASHTIDFDNTQAIVNIEHWTRIIIIGAIELEQPPSNLKTRDVTELEPTRRKPVLNRNKNMIMSSGTMSISGLCTLRNVRNQLNRTYVLKIRLETNYLILAVKRDINLPGTTDVTLLHASIRITISIYRERLMSLYFTTKS